MFIPCSSPHRINFAFMTPGQKFTQALEESAYTPAQFARLLNVEPQGINNWKKRGVSASHLFQAARYLAKDPQWLLLDDVDLPKGFTPEEQAREDYAVNLFATLTEAQQGLVSTLISELAKVPPSKQ